MGIAVLGIDLGKNVCSVVGLDEAGAVVLRRRTKRNNFALDGKLPTRSQLFPAQIGAGDLRPHRPDQLTVRFQPSWRGRSVRTMRTWTSTAR